MGSFQLALILATFLCSLVAGFLFAFAAVVMPGIKSLNDGEFIRAFQVMDRIIQDNHPIFMLVWIGSVLALVISVMLGIGQLDGSGRVFIFLALAAYLLGVQFPTIAINIPLNNKLQSLDVGEMDVIAQKVARENFESPWNKWNAIRAGFAGLSSALLIILVFKL